MGSRLPALTRAQFRQRLLRCLPAVPDPLPDVLHVHYEELCRWNSRLSLVGPGTAADVVERHYGESLAALPLVEPGDRSLLDIGSGAGFPGLVLAAALSSLRVTLTEPRERKWAFLSAAARRSRLSCRCLNVRVERPLAKELPCEIDIVTCRAVALSPGLLEALFERHPRLRFLHWCGAAAPALPGVCRVEREVTLAGSDRRRILEIRNRAA
jgi:16S rRNA (guanine(527)-N(7))-methyltransferase RsmG